MSFCPAFCCSSRPGTKYCFPHRMQFPERQERGSPCWLLELRWMGTKRVQMKGVIGWWFVVTISFLVSPSPSKMGGQSYRVSCLLISVCNTLWWAFLPGFFFLALEILGAKKVPVFPSFIPVSVLASADEPPPLSRWDHGKEQLFKIPRGQLLSTRQAEQLLYLPVITVICVFYRSYFFFTVITTNFHWTWFFSRFFCRTNFYLMLPQTNLKR
jgi:hypothetical protein